MDGNGWKWIGMDGLEWFVVVKNAQESVLYNLKPIKII